MITLNWKTQSVTTSIINYHVNKDGKLLLVNLEKGHATRLVLQLPENFGFKYSNKTLTIFLEE